MKRVINSSKYLKGIVEEGRTFYIGFGELSLTEIAKSYPDLLDLIRGKKTSFTVTGKKGVLKENTHGKFARKQPETKESIWKHIHYYSERFGKDIDFDREFNIWQKEMVHKYNLVLERAETPQREIVLHFPAFQMTDGDEFYRKCTAAMNMAIALGGYFMIYDNIFEPIVPVTKISFNKILGSGTGTIEEKLERIEKEINDFGGKSSEGNSYRFAMLKEKSPSEVTIGIGGFDDYLMFEFSEANLMIFENLKTGNATFVFKLSDFDSKKEINKQNAKYEPSYLKRIIHNNLDDWHKQFTKFFNN